MVDYKNLDWGNAADTSLSNYTNAKEKEGKYTSQKVDLTKYLSLTLPEGKNEGEVVVRLLPNQDNPLEFHMVKKFHNIKIGKNWTKLYDPAQDGEESPLNDMYSILKAGDKTDQDNAKKYISRNFYILRVIQRDKEHEGVKYWRFPHVTDGSGVMDKLMPIIRRLNEKSKGAGAIWNPIAGRDIVIGLVRDTKKNYTKISSIQADDITPLSNDEAKMNEWLNDPKTWKDVYTKKSLSYLRIVAEGQEPVWNAEKKDFVAKATDGEVASFTSPAETSDAPEMEKSQEVDETQIMSVDDLPF